jgi:hypothetical protein
LPGDPIAFHYPEGPESVVVIRKRLMMHFGSKIATRGSQVREEFVLFLNSYAMHVLVDAFLHGPNFSFLDCTVQSYAYGLLVSGHQVMFLRHFASREKFSD